MTANNEQLLTYPLNNKIVSSQFRDGGSLLRQPGRTREELYALGTLGSRDGVNRTQAGGYGKIVELAEEYGLNLWFLETPKYERMYAVRLSEAVYRIPFHPAGAAKRLDRRRNIPDSLRGGVGF